MLPLLDWRVPLVYLLVRRVRVPFLCFLVPCLHTHP